jgi:hypothetical protein
MEYAKLINAVGAYLQMDARTFTRYNKKTLHGEGSESGMSARDAKFVVVDYKDTDVSFHLRAGQIQFNGASITIDQMISAIGKADPSLKMHETIEEAIKSSIGEKYLQAATDILDMTKGYVSDRNDGCLIKFGTYISSEQEPGLSIFVSCHDESVVLTIKE